MATEFDLEVTNDPEFDTRTPEINYRRAHDQEFRLQYDRRHDQWQESVRDVRRLMTGPCPTRDIAVAVERWQECERELIDYCESKTVPVPLEIQLTRELRAALAK